MPLRLHQLVEFWLIHLQLALAGQQQGEVHGKTEGVIELEGILPADGFLRGGRGTLCRLAKDLQATPQGPGKTGLFGLYHRADEILALGDLGKCLTHQVGNHGHQLVHEGIGRTQHMTEARRTP